MAALYARYGATREPLAALALNSRRNANLNPRAFFFKEPMTRDDYFNARWIAEPLCLFDCDVPVDGCVALIVTTGERARDLLHPPAYMAGYGQNTASRRTLLYYTLDDYMACGASLANKLWNSAGLGPHEMDAAQLYDGFNPSTLYWLEAAGFCAEGEGAAFVRDGRIALNELRSTFLLSDSMGDRIRTFRVDRVARIKSGETPLPLRNGPKLAVHILPLSAFGGTRGLDISIPLRAYLGQFMQAGPGLARAKPFSISQGWDQAVNL